jgi:putative ABC transport system permease protein
VNAASLAAKNLYRNKTRTALTALGVAIAVLAFILLRTVVWAWTMGGEVAAKDRVVTRHKVTFVMTLPRRYADQVREAPGVKNATFANWFGGKDPKHESEFFATLAVDTKTFFDVYDEMQVEKPQLEAWMQNRRGAIVGDVLARKLGWKVGDKVTLKSQFIQGDWDFTVEGIYTPTRKSIDASTFVFHWDYMNETLPQRQRDQIGWVVSRVDDPSRAADLGASIDRVFDEKEVQTLSQSERAFNLSFLAMFSAILRAIDIASAVILLIMGLILGNTIAMGVRERTGEYGAMKAIGFLPRHIAAFVLLEALTVGVLGGVLGVALAYPLVEKGMGRFIEENMGSFFPYFRVSAGTALIALALAIVMAGAAGLVPAMRAARLRVADAVRRVGLCKTIARGRRGHDSDTLQPTQYCRPANDEPRNGARHCPRCLRALVVVDVGKWYPQDARPVGAPRQRHRDPQGQ